MDIKSTNDTLGHDHPATDNSEADAAPTMTGATLQLPPVELIPGGFHCDGRGVFDDEGRHIFGAPVWLPAFTKDMTGRRWGVRIEAYDRDGKHHTHDLPMSDLSGYRPAAIAKLTEAGVQLEAGMEAAASRYLQASNPKGRILSTNRVGWVDGKLVFVLPNRTISSTEESVAFVPEKYAPTSRSIHERGSPLEWAQNVAEPCRGNPILQFMLACAFAAPIQKFSGLGSGGIHLHCDTSSGKTTAAQLTASVWGNGVEPGIDPASAYIRSWDTTKSAAEGLLVAHNDLPLCLDEIGVNSSGEIDAFVYMISGGQGRSRSTPEAKLQEQLFWRAFVVSTGEEGVWDKIEHSGKVPKGGQGVRVIDVHCDPVITDPHDKEPGQFADDLKRACSQYYGSAGPAFVHKLIDMAGGDSKKLDATIQRRIEVETALLIPAEGATKEQRRKLKRIGLVVAAGVLAAEFGILPFKGDDIRGAGLVVRDRMLRSSAASEGTRVEDSIREFITAHIAEFGDVDKQSLSGRKVVGYVDTRQELYVLPTKSFEEACGGCNIRSACATLKKRDLLLVDGKGRFQTRHAVEDLKSKGGEGRTRFYAVRMSILDDGIDEAGAKAAALPEADDIPFI